MRHLRFFRVVVVGASFVAATSLATAPASANDAVRHATINRTETIAGYQIQYNAVAVHIEASSPPVTAGIRSRMVTFACTHILVTAGFPPYNIEGECFVEDVNTGAFWPANGPYSEGSTGGGQTGAWILPVSELRLCLRATVHEHSSFPKTVGPLRCAPITV
jgi:hypothetical protein